MSVPISNPELEYNSKYFHKIQNQTNLKPKYAFLNPNLFNPNIKLSVVPLPPRHLNGRFMFYGRKMAFSNLFPSPFIYQTRLYNCNEQYYQERKALFFKDFKIARKIMYEKDPIKIKALGNNIKNYNREVWRSIAPKIMYEGLKIKFTTHPQLKQMLLNTGTGTLIEANPWDNFWGSGVPFKPPYNYYPHSFFGNNIMGKSLEKLRNELKN